jgi:superfamily II DNA/RNA helicase
MLFSASVSRDVEKLATLALRQPVFHWPAAAPPAGEADTVLTHGSSKQLSTGTLELARTVAGLRQEYVFVPAVVKNAYLWHILEVRLGRLCLQFSVISNADVVRRGGCWRL